MALGLVQTKLIWTHTAKIKKLSHRPKIKTVLKFRLQQLKTFDYNFFAGKSGFIKPQRLQEGHDQAHGTCPQVLNHAKQQFWPLSSHNWRASDLPYFANASLLQR
jgi:hypothetical protein